MDPSTVFRRMARLEYAAIRLPFDLFEDLVIVRYWDQDAFVRRGFECFLGSMDWCAGQLLDDEYIIQRGDDLLRYRLLGDGRRSNDGRHPGNSRRPDDGRCPSDS